MFEWTEERKAEARRLWEEGLSAGEIAKQFGTSRNTVMGYLARAGMQRKKQARFGDGAAGGTPKAAGASSEASSGRAVEAGSPVHFVDLELSSCRFPLWPDKRVDASEMFFCGAPAVDGPYCPEHRALCCTPVPAPSRPYREPRRAA